MRRFVCIVTLCFMIVTMFSGCGVLEKLGFGKDDGELTPTSSIAMGEEDALKLSGKVPVHLYFADADSAKLKLEVRYIPISEAAKSVSHLASLIVQELVNGPTDESLKPTIPAGTKLLPPVTINSGVAKVNLSKEFVEKHPGGKTAEEMTIYSIVNSLTELKDVSKVSFLIDGQAKKDLKGSFAFDMPFPRSAALISTDVEPADQASKSKDKKDDKKGDDKDNKVDPKVEPSKSPEGGKTPGAQQDAKTTGGGDASDMGTSSIGPSAGTSNVIDGQQAVPSSGSLFDEETGEILE